MGVSLPNPILPGTIAPFAGGTIPAGWLACGGQAVSRATYAGLFAAISTTFGAGDGSTTFNLPDMRGRAPFGKDDMGGVAANRLTSGGSGVAGATLGAAGGGETVTLTTAQIPSHTHVQTIVGGALGGNFGTTESSQTTISASARSTQTTGSGGAHGVVPPALVTNFIIKF